MARWLVCPSNGAVTRDVPPAEMVAVEEAVWAADVADDVRDVADDVETEMGGVLWRRRRLETPSGAVGELISSSSSGIGPMAVW